MSSGSRLGDDALQLINLPLRTAEGTKLYNVSIVSKFVRSCLAYSSLGELTGSLVLAVSQQLDDSALVWGKAGDLLDDVADESSALG